MEVVDSRVAGWRIKLVDTVADNASSGLIVMGGAMRKVGDQDLRLVGVAVSRGGELLDTGAGAAALGNPARCVAWLANKLATFGAGLQAGGIELHVRTSSGNLTARSRIAVGQRVVVRVAAVASDCGALARKN